jgi:hypothetical protein
MAAIVTKFCPKWSGKTPEIGGQKLSSLAAVKLQRLPKEPLAKVPSHLDSINLSQGIWWHRLSSLC